MLINGKIITKNGKKNINDIKVGDSVLSYNENKNINEYSKVINKFTSTSNSILKITFQNEIFEVTKEHPFYNGKKYINASSLQIGDKILSSNGNYYSIIGIEIIESHKEVYNIEVENNHNYFVGDLGILVHNYGSDSGGSYTDDSGSSDDSDDDDDWREEEIARIKAEIEEKEAERAKYEEMERETAVAKAEFDKGIDELKEAMSGPGCDELVAGAMARGNDIVNLHNSAVDAINGINNEISSLCNQLNSLGDHSQKTPQAGYDKYPEYNYSYPSSNGMMHVDNTKCEEALAHLKNAEKIFEQAEYTLHGISSSSDRLGTAAQKDYNDLHLLPYKLELCLYNLQQADDQFRIATDDLDKMSNALRNMNGADAESLEQRAKYLMENAVARLQDRGREDEAEECMQKMAELHEQYHKHEITEEQFRAEAAYWVSYYSNFDKNKAEAIQNGDTYTPLDFYGNKILDADGNPIEISFEDMSKSLRDLTNNFAFTGLTKDGLDLAFSGDIASLWYGSELEAFNNGYSNSNYEFMQNLYNYVNNDLIDYFDTETFNAKCGWGHEGSETLTNNEIYKQYTLNGHQELLPDNLKGLNDCIDRLTTEGFLLGLNISGLDISKVKEMYADERIFVTDYQAMLTTAGILGINVEDIFWSKDKGYYVAPMNSFTNSESQQYNRSFANVTKDIDDLYNVALHSDDYKSGLEQEYNWHLFNDYVKIGEETINGITIPIYKLDENGNRATVKKDLDGAIIDEDGQRFFNLSNGMNFSEQDVIDIFNGKTIDKFITKNPEGGIDVSFSFINNSQTKEVKDLLSKEFGLMSYNDSLLSLGSLKDMCDAIDSSGNLNWQDVYTELKTEISEIKNGKTESSNLQALQSALGLEGKNFSTKDAIDKLQELLQNDKTKSSAVDLIKNLQSTYNIENQNRAGLLHAGDELEILGYSFAKGFKGAIEGISDAVAVQTHSDAALTFMDKLKQKFSGDSNNDSSFLSKVDSILTKINPIASGIKNAEALGVGFLNLLGINHGIELKEDTILSMLANSLSPELDSSNKYKDWKMQNPDSYLKGKYEFMQDSNAFASGFSNFIKSLPAASRSQYEELYQKGFDYSKFSTDKLSEIYNSDKYSAHMKGDKNVSFTDEEMYYVHLLDNIDFSKMKEDMIFNDGLDMHIDNPNPTAADVASYAFSTLGAKVTNMVENAYEQYYYQQNGYMNLESIDRFERAFSDYVLGIDTFNNYESIKNNVDIMDRVKTQYDVRENAIYDRTSEWWNNYKEENARKYNYSSVQEDNFFFKANEQIGRMTPLVASNVAALALSTLAPGASPVLAEAISTIGKVLFFESAYGDAASQAFREGASYSDAMNYALMSATLEEFTEHMFTDIAGFSKVGENFLEKLASKAVDKLSFGLTEKTIAGKIAKDLIVAGFGEGMEEIVSDSVNPFLEALTYKKDQTGLDIYHEQVSTESLLNTFLISAFTGSVFQGAHLGGESLSLYHNVNTMNKDMKTVMEITNKNDARSKIVDEIKKEVYKQLMLSDELSLNERYKVIDNTINEISEKYESNPEMKDMVDEYKSFRDSYYTKTSELKVDGKTVAVVPSALANNVKSSMKIRDRLMKFNGSQIEFSSDSVANLVINEMDRMSYEVTEKMKTIISNPNIINDPILSEKIEEVYVPMQALPINKILSDSGIKSREALISLLKSSNDMTSKVQNQIKLLETQIKESNEAKNNPDYTTLVKARDLYDEVANIFEDKYDIKAIVSLPNNIDVKEINNKDGIHTYEISYVNENGENLKYTIQTLNNLQLDSRVMDKANIAELLLSAIKNNQKYVEFVKNANGNIVSQVSNTLIQNRINEINDLLLKSDNNQELEKLQQEKQELNDLINNLINTDENFLHSYIDFVINQKTIILNQLNSLLKSSNDPIIKEKINEITDLLKKTEFEKILKPERIEVIEKNIKNLNKDSKAKIKNYKNMLKESRNALKNISEYHNQFFEAQEKFSKLRNAINDNNNIDIKLSDIISFKMIKNASNIYSYIVTYTNDDGKTIEYTFLSNNNLKMDLKYVDKVQLNDMIKEIVENNHKYVNFYFDKNGKLSKTVANDIIENQIKLIDKELTELQKKDNERIFVDEEDTTRSRIKELQNEKSRLNDELETKTKEKNTEQVQQIQQDLTSDLKANVTENTTSTQSTPASVIDTIARDSTIADVTRSTVLQEVASRQTVTEEDKTKVSDTVAYDTATAASAVITQSTIQNIIEDAANNRASVEVNVGESTQTILNIDEIRKNFNWQKNLLNQLKMDFNDAINSENIKDLKLCIEQMNEIFNRINNYLVQADTIVNFSQNENLVNAINEYQKYFKELNRYEVSYPNINDISNTFLQLEQSFEKVSNEFNKAVDVYNNEDINVVSPYETLRNNPNLEVKRVSDLDITEQSIGNINFAKATFNYNNSYIGYDYVITPKTSLQETINAINSSNIDGRVLIEISNTLELNEELIKLIPDNVNVRITGSYTMSFLQTFRNVDDAYASLKNVTYNKSELLVINEEITKFDAFIKEHGENLTDLEKAKLTYDYLRDRNRIRYLNKGEFKGDNQTRAKHFSSLTALTDGVSTCQGFAHTYQALVERLGIECYELSGRLSVTKKSSRGMDSHAFNAVVIDGNTFLVDTVRNDQHAPFNEGTGFGVKNISEYNIDAYKNQAVMSSDINTYMDENGVMHDMGIKIGNTVITPEYIKINDSVISTEDINSLFSNYKELEDILLFDRGITSKLFKAIREAQKQGISYNIDDKAQRLIDAFANLNDGEVLFNPMNVYEGNTPFVIPAELVEKYGEMSINIFAQQLQLGKGINVGKFFDFLNEESVKSHLTVFEDQMLFLENGLPTKINGVSLSSLILGIEDGNFPTVFNNELQTLARFIKENNVQTNFSEKVTNVINALKSVNQNENVVNMQDVVNNGAVPIIMPETITLRDGEIIKSKYILDMLSSEKSIYHALASKYSTINRENIGEILDSLEMNHPEVANFYENQIELIDSVKDNYIYENGDNYVVLPKTIDKYNTSDLVDLMNYDKSNASFINQVINSDFKTKKQALKALEKLKSEINKSNPNLDVSIDSRVIEALNENKKSFEAIQSKLQGLLEQMRTNNFGARQSIVNDLLHKVGVNNVVDQIFEKNIKTEDFMKALDELNISDEELLNMIANNYKDNIMSHVYSKIMDIKVFNGLIEQVQRNFTDMSVKDAIKVLYLLESAESGGHGICNYATMANLIFQQYIGNEAKFLQDFGFEMYVLTDTGRVLNDARLLVDMFTKINDGTLIKFENGNYIVSNESNYLNLASQWNLINTYLTEKGLDLRVNRSFVSSTYSSIMEYNDIISRIYDNLKNGNNVMISSNGFTLIDSNGIKETNLGGHIMTVVGIDSNGNLIVDSWGERYTLNLREELQNSGNKTEKGSERYVTVQIFETNNNGITNSDTNSDIAESYARNEEYKQSEKVNIDEVIVDNTFYNNETQTLTIDGTEFTRERLEKLFKRFGSDMTDYIRNGNIDGVDVIKFLKEVKKLQDTGAIKIESSSIKHLLNELNHVNENDYILNLVESYNKYVSFVTIDKSLVDKYGIEFIESFKKDIIGELDNNISNAYYESRLLFLQEESIKNNYELFENKILRLVDGLPYEFDLVSVKTMLSAIEHRTVASYYEDALIEFARYLSKNNVEINASEYVLEVLNKIKVPEGKYITNIVDVVNDGVNPIIIDSTIKVGNNVYESKEIIKVLENKNSQLFVIMNRSYGILNQKNLTDIINKFMKENPSLRERYSNSLELLNKINSSYIYKIDFINYELLPNKFDNFRTIDLMEAIMNKDEGRTRLLNLDLEARASAVNAIESLENYVKENNIKFEYDTQALKEELLTEREIKIVEIRSRLYEIYKNNLSRGSTFGVQQQKVYRVLQNLNVHNVLNSIFGVKNVDSDFLKGLEEANISEEEFKQALINYNSNSFTVPRFDIEDSLMILENLVNQVKSIYDGMTHIEAIKFLYLMESKEAGSRGICNYAAFANLIFEKYIGNEAKFLQDFGYPMYIETKAGRVLNDSQLLTDMYATINDGNLVKFENGKYIIENTSNKYLNLASNPSLLNDFLAKKGIKLQLDLVTEQRTGLLQTKQVTLHEDWLDIISNEIKNGNTVMLSSSGFNIYKPDGTLFKNNVGGHIMTVVGISSNGNLIVDSWGMELEIDLRSELQHTGTATGNSYLMIQSYRLVDGDTINSTATSAQANEVYDSLDDIEMIDASEEVTAPVLTEEQIIARDLSTIESLSKTDLLNALSSNEYQGINITELLQKVDLNSISDTNLRRVAKIVQELNENKVILNMDTLYDYIFSKPLIINSEYIEVFEVYSNELNLIKNLTYPTGLVNALSNNIDYSSVFELEKYDSEILKSIENMYFKVFYEIKTNETNGKRLYNLNDVIRQIQHNRDIKPIFVDTVFTVRSGNTITIQEINDFLDGITILDRVQKNEVYEAASMYARNLNKIFKNSSNSANLQNQALNEILDLNAKLKSFGLRGLFTDKLYRFRASSNDMYYNVPKRVNYRADNGTTIYCESGTLENGFIKHIRENIDRTVTTIYDIQVLEAIRDFAVNELGISNSAIDGYIRTYGRTLIFNDQNQSHRIFEDAVRRYISGIESHIASITDLAIKTNLTNQFNTTVNGIETYRVNKDNLIKLYKQAGFIVESGNNRIFTDYIIDQDIMANFEKVLKEYSGNITEQQADNVKDVASYATKAIFENALEQVSRNSIYILDGEWKRLNVNGRSLQGFIVYVEPSFDMNNPKKTQVLLNYKQGYHYKNFHILDAVQQGHYNIVECINIQIEEEIRRNGSARGLLTSGSEAYIKDPLFRTIADILINNPNTNLNSLWGSTKHILNLESKVIKEISKNQSVKKEGIKDLYKDTNDRAKAILDEIVDDMFNATGNVDLATLFSNGLNSHASDLLNSLMYQSTTTSARVNTNTNNQKSAAISAKELNSMYDSNVRADKQVSKYLDKFASEYTLENKEKVREVYKYLKENNPKAKIAEAIKEYYESKIKTREYTTYNYQGVDIKIPVDLNVNNQVYTVEHIIEQLDSLLEMYGDVNLSEIVIHDTACPINFILEEQHGINNFDAIGDTDGRTINLYATTKIDDMTLSHEYAHLISNELVKNNKNITSEWINAMNSDNLYVNEYASTNISEDFAESVAAYIENPSEFIENFPNRAKFIQSHIDTSGTIDITKTGKVFKHIKMEKQVTDGSIDTNSSARISMDSIKNKAKDIGKQAKKDTASVLAAMQIFSNGVMNNNAETSLEATITNNLNNQITSEEQYVARNIVDDDIIMEDVSTTRHRTIEEFAEEIGQILRDSWGDRLIVKDIETLENGYHIYTTALDLFVPKNFNDAKDIDIYFQGSGGRGGQAETSIYNAIEESVLSENSDKIVLTLNECSDHAYAKPIADILKPEGFEHYNLYGFSAGGDTSLYHLISRLKENPNLPPQIVCMLDTADNGCQLRLKEEDFEALKNNKTTIIMIEDTNPGNYAPAREQGVIKEIAKNADVIIATRRADHGDIAIDAFKQNLLGFINGNISKLDVASGEYTFEVYNKETGEFEVVSDEVAYTRIRQRDPNFEKAYEDIETSTVKLRQDTVTNSTNMENFTQELNTSYESGLVSTTNYLDKFASEYIVENKEKVEEIYKFLKEKNPSIDVAKEIRNYYESKLNERGFTTTEDNGVKIEIINSIDTNAQVYTSEYVSERLSELRIMYPNVNLNEVVIYDTACPSNMIFAEKYGIDGFNALADTDGSTIKLYATTEVDDMTLSHEYAHLIANELVKNNPNVSNEWINAMNADNAYVNEYAKTSVEEDFAESVAAYIENPSEFIKNFPNRAAFIQEYVDSSGKVDINKTGKSIEKIEMHEKVTSGSINTNSSARGILSKLFGLDKYLNSSDQKKYEMLDEFDTKSKIKLISSMQDKEIFIKSLEKLKGRKDIVSLLNNLENEEFKSLIIDKLSSAKATEQLTKLAVDALSNNGIECPINGNNKAIVPDNYNEYGIKNAKKYELQLSMLSQQWGITPSEVQTVIEDKLKEFMENCMFGRRVKSVGDIIKSGIILNQFQSGRSSGNYDPYTRVESERSVFGVDLDVTNGDRPIYGMLFPEDVEANYDYFFKYTGPGFFYNDRYGCVLVLDKEKILKNTTFTLGDSLAYSTDVIGSRVDNPKFFGFGNNILYKKVMNMSLEEFKKCQLKDIFYDNKNSDYCNDYIELQIYGYDLHKIDIIKEVLFNIPPTSIEQELLEKNGIAWRVLN